MQLDVGNESYLSQQGCLDHLLTWLFLREGYPPVSSIWIPWVYCGKVSSSQLYYFPTYELLSSDRRTDRKRCIWANSAICTGGLNKSVLSNGTEMYALLKNCPPIRIQLVWVRTNESESGASVAFLILEWPRCVSQHINYFDARTESLIPLDTIKF